MEFTPLLEWNMILPWAWYFCKRGEPGERHLEAKVKLATRNGTTIVAASATEVERFHLRDRNISRTLRSVCAIYSIEETLPTGLGSFFRSTLPC